LGLVIRISYVAFFAPRVHTGGLFLFDGKYPLGGFFQLIGLY